MKKRFKMPSAFTILFALIAIVSFSTWFIPGGEWVDGTYKTIEANPQGLWQFFAAPLEGFFAASDIILFVLVIGGFLGLVMKTGALSAGISKLLKVFKGREHWLIPILMILFAIGGSTYGMAEETIAFYPLIIPVFLAAGFDVVTPVMVILLGAGVGVLGSTINPFSIGAAVDAANAAGVDKISMGLGMGHRFLILVVLLVIAIVWTVKYALKVKEDISNSIVSDLHEKHLKRLLDKDHDKEIKFTKRHGVILGLFALTFVIMILGVIPWAWKFDILVFDNLYNFLAEKAPFLGFIPNATDAYWDSYDAVKTMPAALGDWWFGQLTVLFFIASLVIGKVAKMKENEIVNAFVEGAKDLLTVALIIGVARGIKVVMTASGIDATILYWGVESLKGLGEVAFINLTYIFYIPMSFLIPSTSGLAGASMPIMAPLGDMVYNVTNGTGAALVITAFASAEGVVNLITPTSGVVMGALAISGIPFNRWVKHVFKFLVISSLVVMAVLTLSTFIGVV